MNQIYRYAMLFTLVGVALFIKIFSLFPSAIEKYYSNGAYPVISRVLRWLFGWIPFSIGDIFYAIAALLLLAGCWKLIRSIRQKKVNLDWLLRLGVKVMTVWLWVYIIFNVFWGLNYNRLGIADQAGLNVTEYHNAEVDTLVVTLIDRMNRLRDAGVPERNDLVRKRTLFRNSFQSYQVPSEELPFLKFRGQSVKPSLFSYLGNYLGFTGYYNPFTGEAQVNTTVPVFVQPFTTCHEIGHQLGYAKENEANMAGFLTAKHSASAAFRYSAYFDVYLYAMRDLYTRDSARSKILFERLSPGVKDDLIALREFNNQHVGLLEPLVRSIYAQYLRVNQQPGGMMSYNQVVALVIAYIRKYGMDEV
ncbi:DUF3810 domain-containing protein [Flavihumibacter profundi]|jgi:hypothetical protein|uniref:DUF3810 domain-containing protein n=1 Tax=Flavihumibacter profundi TaxID=2716883 RepID=UPI001CC59DAF|nr:DUF3810 domain-containing protein [Flavihumibacter profundi]MBZ5857011.1 DUF3810 domain-containing protein [Flavihumibacter profundi]